MEELKRSHDAEKDKFLRCMVDVIVNNLSYDLTEGSAKRQLEETGELVGTYIPDKVVRLIKEHGYYTVKSLISVLAERAKQIKGDEDATED